MYSVRREKEQTWDGKDKGPLLYMKGRNETSVFYNQHNNSWGMEREQDKNGFAQFLTWICTHFLLLPTYSPLMLLLKDISYGDKNTRDFLLLPGWHRTLYTLCLVSLYYRIFE